MTFMRSFRFKKILILLLVLFGVAVVWYFQLSARHQAIVKTKILHSLHIIDPNWETARLEDRIQLVSPDLLVDDIYQSMDGPQAVLNVNVNPNRQGLKWITGFKAEVIKEGTKEHNNDFLCHTNLDYYDAIHYKNLNLPKRINTIYPRLGTLSNGINELHFPEGFGFPMTANDPLIVASRTLNHNIEDPFFKVKHHISLFTSENDKPLKPLRPKGLVLMLPYDLENPYNSKKEDPNLCSPIDLKNHSGPGPDGVSLSAHWQLPQGRQRYEFEVTYQLYLQQDVQVHAMAAHLHPGAERFMLYDISEEKPIYEFHCENYQDKIGLKHVPIYSSSEGLTLKADHRYKLVLDTHNPSAEFRDMMAVLFLYIYDEELDLHLQATGLN